MNKQDRITKRVQDIINIMDRYGTDTPHLRNYISDCMESDIRREKNRIYKEHPILHTAIPTQRKEK